MRSSVRSVALFAALVVLAACSKEQQVTEKIGVARTGYEPTETRIEFTAGGDWTIFAFRRPPSANRCRFVWPAFESQILDEQGKVIVSSPHRAVTDTDCLPQKGELLHFWRADELKKSMQTYQDEGGAPVDKLLEPDHRYVLRLHFAPAAPFEHDVYRSYVRKVYPWTRS